MNFKKFFQSSIALIGIILLVTFFWWGMQWFSDSLENFFEFKVSQEQNEFLASVAPVPIQEKLISKNPDMSEPELNVESAISLQTDFINLEQVLFSKNEEVKMPIASLTKLMTAVVVFENFDLSTSVKISQIAANQDARGLLKPGESFKAKDLLFDMLIESNNSAAYAFYQALGQDKFLKLMNLKANEIGLKNTYFSGPTGLALTNYSTAKDLANFAKYVLNNQNLIIDIAATPEFDLYNDKGVFHHKIYNLNDLLRDPELKDRIIFGKTGQTKDAGECLLLVLKAPENNGYLLNVVLNAKDRFSEMKKLINWEDKAYIWK